MARLPNWENVTSSIFFDPMSPDPPFFMGKSTIPWLVVLANHLEK